MKHVRSKIRNHGMANLVRSFVGREVLRIFKGPISTRTAPSLQELDAHSGATYRSAVEALEDLIGDAAGYVSEFEEVSEGLKRQMSVGVHGFPHVWSIEHETAILLYGITRAAKPEHVLETGVANGTSTFIILSALRANGRGRLTSTDLALDAGALVPEDLRTRWNFQPVSPENVEDSMRSVIAGSGPFDMYFHDADHRYLGQMFEYRLVWPHVAPGSWFLSDDIHYGRAWIDFTAAHGLRAAMLVDARKVTGIAMKPA